MTRTLAVALLLALAAACRRAPESGKQPQPPPPPPLYVYLVNCDGSVARFELGKTNPAHTVLLTARTSAYLIPPARGDNCSVNSPRLEMRSSRLFVVTPHEEGRNTRLWRVLGFRIPDFAFTDAIELESATAIEPEILPSGDGTRLFVSMRLGRRRPEDGRILAYRIEHPRAARLLEETLDEAWFSDGAYLGPDGATIYDREQRIQPDGENEEFALDNLVGTPEGVALEPYLISDKRGRKTLAAEFADAAGMRILYRIVSGSASALAVLDTQTDRVAVIGTVLATSAKNAHLTPDGGRVLVEEVRDTRAAEPDKTGRLAIFDSTTGAQGASWNFPEIGGTASRLLGISDRGEVLYAAQGRVLIWDLRAARKSERDPGVPLDRYTRCLFSSK